MRNITLVRAVDMAVGAEICVKRSAEHVDKLATGLESAKITQMDQLMARIDQPGRHDRRDDGVRAGTSIPNYRNPGRPNLPRSHLRLICLHNAMRGAWLKHHQNYYC